MGTKKRSFSLSFSFFLPFFFFFFFYHYFFNFASLYILFIAKMLLILYNHSTFPTPSDVFIHRSQKNKRQKHCTFDLLFLLVNSIIFEMLRFACWLILSKRICILLAITSIIYSEIGLCTVNMPFKRKRECERDRQSERCSGWELQHFTHTQF